MGVSEDEQRMICNTCRQDKQESEFYNHHRTRCKSCHSNYQKRYHANNKDKRATYSRNFYGRNKESILTTNREYYFKNKAQHQELCRKRALERRHCDPQYKLTKLLRKRLNSAIKNGARSGSAVRDLGCSIEQLKAHLESQFQPGMTWDNWSFHGWHIDHILPLDGFDLTDREQLLKACHYTNLQPLWAKDNLSKSNKVQYGKD